eukprot:scaffold303_cov49-Cyclotella_meneghiniana.AAC.2
MMMFFPTKDILHNHNKTLALCAAVSVSCDVVQAKGTPLLRRNAKPKFKSGVSLNYCFVTLCHADVSTRTVDHEGCEPPTCDCDVSPP